MKTFAIKTTLAACLLAPVMAMAADSGAASFSVTAEKDFKLDGFGFTSIAASWTDLTAALKKTNVSQQFQASTLDWKLFRDNTLVRSGSFADVAGDTNSGKIVINEAGLKSGEYKVIFAGNWNLPGNKSAWDRSVDERVYLAKPVSYSVSPVPEPETYAMLLVGLALVATIAKRRKKSDAA